MLSLHEDKLKLYEADPYFRDSIDDIHHYFDKSVFDQLHHVAPVIFRPDSIVTRHYFTVVEQIMEKGYVPIYITPFEYCRFKVRECWKYQLNIASRDRIDVMDMILTGFTSLYVLFYKESSKEAVSATNELSRYKGPSLPKERKIGQLRYSAESAQVSVLTYIHVSDEPSDIIREIGAFFDREQRVKIYKTMLNPLAIEIETEFMRVAELYELHSLKYEEVRKKAEQVALDQKNGEELLLKFVQLENRGISWREVKMLMEEKYPSFTYWDIVSVCAKYAETHFRDRDPIVRDEIG